MPNDTLTLLRETLRKRGANTAAISTAAEELCKLVDHWNTLHWDDRNRLTEENKKLRERIERLESKSGA